MRLLLILLLTLITSCSKAGFMETELIQIRRKIINMDII